MEAGADEELGEDGLPVTDLGQEADKPLILLGLASTPDVGRPDTPFEIPNGPSPSADASVF